MKLHFFIISFLTIFVSTPASSESVFDTPYIPPKSEKVGDISGATWVLDRISDIENLDGTQKKDKGLQTIKSAMQAIKAFEEKKEGWTGSISFSYSDEHNQNSQEEDFNIGTKIDLKKGDYPVQTRVKLDVSIEEDGNDFKEELGSLLISHDRYLHPNFEGFVFSELIQIDPLGIERRWEVGGGIKFEWHFFTTGIGRAINQLFVKKNKTALKDDYWQDVNQDDQVISHKAGEYLGQRFTDVKYDSSPDMPSDAGGKYSSAERKKICTYYDDKNIKIAKDKDCDWTKPSQYNISRAAMLLKEENFRQGLRRQESRLELGLSAAILNEFVDGSVDVIGQGDFSGKIVKDLKVDSEQNPVLSLRPKIVYKLRDNLTFYAHHFFKKRFNDDSKNRIDNSKFFDYGSSKVSIQYSVDSEVTLSLNYDHYIENQPFFIEHSTLAENEKIIEFLNSHPDTPSYNESFFSNTGPESYEKFSAEVTIKLGS